jgi:hypothetical protein
VNGSLRASILAARVLDGYDIDVGAKREGDWPEEGG